MLPLKLEKRPNFSHLWRRISAWILHPGTSRRLAWSLVLLSVGMGILTYIAFSRQDIHGFHPRSVTLLLNIDLGILLFIFLVIARRVIRLFVQRREGAAGAALHSRLVSLFSILTITPAIIMGLLMVLFFHAGVESWFDDKVKTALNGSRAVADAYLKEHEKVIRVHTDAMARSIEKILTIAEAEMREERGSLHNPSELGISSEKLSFIVNDQARARGLNEAVVFDANGILARSQLAYALDLHPVTPEDLQRARTSVILYVSPEGDRVRALSIVDEIRGIYLLVGRPLDPKILKQISTTKEAVDVYAELEKNLGDLSIQLFLIFGLITLMLLMGAILVGIISANKLAQPIGDLIHAAEKVSQGNLKTRVRVSEDSDVGKLSQTFNTMTAKLDQQQKNLLRANDVLDERRQFIEAVLSGVSTGIASLSEKGRIRMMNAAGMKIFGLSEAPTGFIHTLFSKYHCHLFEEGFPPTPFQTQIKVFVKGQERQLILQLSAESETKNFGYVMTFEDITSLLQVQRQAAWSDVARRVAHEIKNPLTPIQLATERLRKRIGKDLPEDEQKVLEKCLQTIGRQVTHMGNIVREFSHFARLPQPTLKDIDLVKLIQNHMDETILPSFKDITFTFSGAQTLPLSVDPEQVVQILDNLIQNSRDAMEESETAEKAIRISLEQKNNYAVLTLQDNGPGFPPDHIHQLTEPYITHKEKGTGLGLAIVRKIVEDHKGRILLSNTDQGAQTRIEFPLPLKKGSEAA